jgi:hypothetical protein
VLIVAKRVLSLIKNLIFLFLGVVKGWQLECQECSQNQESSLIGVKSKVSRVDSVSFGVRLFSFWMLEWQFYFM